MKRGFSYLLLLILLVGCSDDKNDGRHVDGKETQLLISTKQVRLATRTGEDISNKINSLEGLVLEKEDNFIYTYRVTPKETSSEGEYSITLRPADVPVKLLFIANYTDFQDIELGCSFNDITACLFQPFTSEGLTTLPMYGEINFPEGVTAQNTNEAEEVLLLRSVAGVDISLKEELHTAGTFLLKSIQAYRANNQIQIIPATSVLVVEEDEFKVNAPSVPEGAENNITTDFISTGNAIVQSLDRIYVPESEEKTSGNTCLIVGGIYRGNGYDSNNTTTYYRIDFKDANQEPTGEILRNHLYDIVITNVTGPGTTHPEDADGEEIKTVFMDWENSDHNIEL